MANMLHATPEQLRNTASKFETTSNEIKSLTSEMTSIVSGMSGNIWTGQAQARYNTKFTGLQDDIMRMHKLIQEHVDDLRTIAQEYDRAENTSISHADALKSDVL